MARVESEKQIYYFRNWHRYMRYQARRCANPEWCCQSTDLTHRAYIEMVTAPQGPAMYGAFRALVVLGVQCEPRGVLARVGGQPLTPREIAARIHMPAALVGRVLPIAADLGWLGIADSVATAVSVIESDSRNDARMAATTETPSAARSAARNDAPSDPCATHLCKQQEQEQEKKERTNPVTDEAKARESLDRLGIAPQVANGLIFEHGPAGIARAFESLNRAIKRGKRPKNPAGYVVEVLKREAESNA